ncbi:hypothetical protein N7499_000270 [Penicillium canescens]|uniref:Uncharacterized protein n=1 Tax=Penicillium canescens TaxID=5083 RepID=A0AAD6NAL6_PENCN|nr:uncharacterized protein N7446_011530 [Penicillium canescens]KAJ6004200.1 hypothetical protein N7522_005845 [Penicillium canescens]KAJ6029124.1 hypothetical protein N7444_012111 [Penicillium canescens]KAJ6047556.1 hypothetical protein N7460_003703 [Penicillium canescens]KAJ6048847.1 hypothetical protein N7446_011530 [Penicillium canescens]KAJ6100640.1 hypothetical protein N7499_000270 [Penicillium canescens]
MIIIQATTTRPHPIHRGALPLTNRDQPSSRNQVPDQIPRNQGSRTHAPPATPQPATPASSSIHPTAPSIPAPLFAADLSQKKYGKGEHPRPILSMAVFPRSYPPQPLAPTVLTEAKWTQEPQIAADTEPFLRS